MGKENIGLKIGASRLSAARVVLNGSAELIQVAEGPLARGIVAGGEVKDVEALAVALKAFFKLHKLPRRGIRIGVSNNRIGVRTIELAGIEDPKQLGNAVRFRAQEALPIPIEEAVLDYQVLSETKNAEGLPSTRVLSSSPTAISSIPISRHSKQPASRWPASISRHLRYFAP